MKPAFMRVSPVHIHGVQADRLMMVLRTRGCEYARDHDGGCTVCGFINHARQDITEQDILRQFEHALECLTVYDDVKEIDILTLGSFLNDREISPELRQRICSRVRRLQGIRRVSIESRSEYLTRDKLLSCKHLLNRKTILEFGIGLESANDDIRNRVIKKGLSREDFEQVVTIVKETGCDLLVYLLVKPQGLTEAQAIDDAVGSAEYVYGVAAKYGVRARIAYEPVFICENTPLEMFFLNGDYHLVNLWSVVDIIRRSHHLGEIFVGLSDENLSFERMPSSCPKCTKLILDEIEHFNRTQDIAGLEQLDCDCKASYESQVRKENVVC